MKKVFYAKDLKTILVGYGEDPTEAKKSDYVEIEAFSKQHVDWDLEKIFSFFNHDVYNPLSRPEGQQWIRDNGLHHTSMSCGDIIEVDGVPNICMPGGWLEIKWS